MTGSAPPEHRVAVAIYDGECLVCANFASLLRRLISPHLIDIVPCGSAIQRKLAPHVSLDLCRKAFVFVDERGTVASGSEAASKALSAVPALARYRPLIASLAGRSLARIVYFGTQLLRRMERRTRAK